MNCYALRAIARARLLFFSFLADLSNFLWRESDSPSCVSKADRKTIFFTCRRQLRDIPQFGASGCNVSSYTGGDCCRVRGLENNTVRLGQNCVSKLESLSMYRGKGVTPGISGTTKQ